MDNGADSGYYSTLLPARCLGYSFTIHDITWTCRDIGGHGRSPVPPLLDVAAEVVGMDVDEPPVADDRDRAIGDPPPQRLHRAAENSAGVGKREERSSPTGSAFVMRGGTSVSLDLAHCRAGRSPCQDSDECDQGRMRRTRLRRWLACLCRLVPALLPAAAHSRPAVWATRHGRPSRVRTCQIWARM